MEKILVSGIGGPAGMAVASFFRGSGFSVVGTDISFVGSGLDGFFLVPRGDSPEFSPALMEILRMERPLLFVSPVTEELPQVARLKEEIGAMGIRMFSSDPHPVDIANDKYLTACALRDLEIPAPRTLADEGLQSGLHYPELAAFVDGLVVWDYFYLEGRSPSTSETVAKFFVDRYGAERIFIAIGLWGKEKTVSPLELSQALAFARRGGARKVWITPNHLLTADHWNGVVRTLRVKI
jgi:hypothetical protein